MCNFALQKNRYNRNMTRTLLLVALGGGIGSALRFLISKFIQENIGGTFPFATMTVNVIGCLLIGLFYGLSARGKLYNEPTKALFTTGLCGGFTTFSTFCNENMSLLKNDNAITTLTYSSCSIILGFAAVAAGYWIAERA